MSAPPQLFMSCLFRYGVLLEHDRTESAKQVELLLFPLKRGDFQLRYTREVGIQTECPLGYLSVPIPRLVRMETVVGVMLWQKSFVDACRPWNLIDSFSHELT